MNEKSELKPLSIHFNHITGIQSIIKGLPTIFDHIIKKNSIYLISVLTFVIPIYLFFTPPDDTDGGPMLGYNFLFFFPMLILMIILSTVLLIFALKSFNKNKLINSILVSSTFPALFLVVLTILNFLRIDRNNSDYKVPVEVLNRSQKISVNPNLTITMNGYTYQKNRKKIEFIPETFNKIKYTTNTFCQGNFTTFYLYYTVVNDSLNIYIPDGKPLYYTDDKLKQLPIKAFKLNVAKKDSLDLLTKKQLIKKFTWNN